MEQMQAFNTPVNIVVTHYRKRLCDPDNLNSKGAIDAIVDLGLLRDDSAKEIKSIKHQQIQSSQEKTVIELIEA